MPRFARLFEAAADTLNAYYQAVAEGNIDSIMALWIDEEFATFICADGSHLAGLDSIRAGLATQLANRPVTVEPLDIRVYDSLGTVVYAIAEAHQPAEPGSSPAMVFSTYVMVHERGEWRIAHIHASAIADEAAGQIAAKMRHGQGPLH
ncbi:nuclear transport factor 2 family protein [Caballeronia sordidicola]|uniref:nuclear transport factor 2 family protein n=1 Tax=Caballeronia sordidicola TaxID=196367 RepID=UPI0004D0011E|nr:nuclear transport factor 2 family protein [Caballeronia sordidicola]